MPEFTSKRFRDVFWISARASGARLGYALAFPAGTVVRLLLYVVSGFSRTHEVRLKADTTYAIVWRSVLLAVIGGSVTCEGPFIRLRKCGQTVLTELRDALS